MNWKTETMEWIFMSYRELKNLFLTFFEAIIGLKWLNLLDSPTSTPIFIVANRLFLQSSITSVEFKKTLPVNLENFFVYFFKNFLLKVDLKNLHLSVSKNIDRK